MRTALLHFAQYFVSFDIFFFTELDISVMIYLEKKCNYKSSNHQKNIFIYKSFIRNKISFIRRQLLHRYFNKKQLFRIIEQ